MPTISAKLADALYDFFTDLRGDYDDLRSANLTHFSSAVGANFETKVRRLEGELEQELEVFAAARPERVAD